MEEPRTSSQPSPQPEKGNRHGSVVSRVDIDYFDPDGVQDLQDTLTRRGTSASLPQTLSHDELKNLVLDGNFDLEKTLNFFTRKREEANIELRDLGVLFKDLRVVGLEPSASTQPTLGSLLNPLNILPKIRTFRHPAVRDILSGFNGVVRPGEMLLVLGQPGSGCSTLLKTLANQRDEYLSVQGDVFYDALTPNDVKKHFRGDVQYCPEDDVHFPTLTVDQTLKFAARMRAPHVRLFDQSREQYVDLVTTIISTIFGLRHVKNTPVGDASIRGVSGGEKKRVSIAEAMVTRLRIGAWDNSTRGLDSSTAHEFVKALRIATDINRVTTFVSIYQASESLYELFDKVCVIHEGRMAYFGPARDAKKFFFDMGYEPLNSRQVTPDFLVACTDPKSRLTRQGFSNVPRSAAEFAEYYKKSPIAEQNWRDMEEYERDYVSHPERVNAYRDNARLEHAVHSRKSSPYTVSLPMQARAVMLRRVQILKGNPLPVVIQLVLFIFQAIIIGTVFYNLSDATATYYSRGGVLFFTLLYAALSSLAEIPALFGQRPIVERHQKGALYHPFIEAVALTLVDIPLTFITTIIYAVIIYFLVGLQKSAGQFFVLYLFLFIISLTMKAWFRAIAAGFKQEASAQTMAGIFLLAMVIYTGYTIPKPSMVKALKWISYINPIRYGFESIITNEFRTLNGQCSNLIPRGAGYEGVSAANQVCTSLGARAGSTTVDGPTFVKLSYSYSYSHVWLNLGVVCAFFGAFLAALFLFAEFNNSSTEVSSVVQYTKRRNQDERVQNMDEEKAKVEEVQDKRGELIKQDSKKTITNDDARHLFSWQHLNYKVHVSGGEERVLLDDISGYVAPGKLTALMGESGAGKTTLLNVLAQRAGTGIVTGDRFVNGQALPPDFQSQTGYCQQTDTHLPTTTVREALLFSAKLRQPASVPLKEKEEYVDRCLEMCGLHAFADAVVGTLGVEQKKRTTIGVELAAKPKLLLFLDEPTSGLDSQSAWAIMAFLKDLANNGQAILCTIHQPSAELFSVFDRLLLLQKGGKTVYFGELGHNASALISYLERNGARHCEPRENPAEYMLDVIGAGATASSKQNWNQLWKESVESQDLQSEIDKIHSEGRNHPPVEATLEKEFANSWGYQVKELFIRDSLAHWRDPTYLLAKLALNIVGGLFIGFTFYKTKSSQQGSQNKIFAVFMSLVISNPITNQLQVPFIKMRNIYEIRERPSRMYSWSALITSQILAEIPWNILAATLYFLCWYWTVGLPTSRAGYTWLMLSVVFPMFYTTFGQAVASMAPNEQIANLLFAFLFSFIFTFNGVLQPYRQLGWWKWMYRVSPMTYVVEGLVGQAVGRSKIQCSSVEFVTIQPPSGQSCEAYLSRYIQRAGGYLGDSGDNGSCKFCPFSTTDALLGTNFNIFYSHHWRNLGIVLGVTLFNVAAVYGLTYWFRVRTWSLRSKFRSRKSTTTSG